MVHMYPIYFILLSGSTHLTLGQKTLQPYGPKMCEELCQSTEGCSDHVFDEVQMACRLVINTQTSINTSSGTDSGEFCVPRNEFISKRNDPDEKISNQNEYDTPCDTLHTECQDGNFYEVKRLVCQGLVDINCKASSNGETCIMIAAEENYQDVFDFLIQQGCDLLAVDSDNNTVLHNACFGENTYMVKKLVDDYNSDIHWRNLKGRTPLMYTEEIQDVKFFFEKGADFKTIDRENNTFLHLAVFNRYENVVRYVLSLNIIDVECRGKDGKTALMVAVEYGRIPIVDLLHKEHNASLTSTDDFGFNVLHIACHAGHMKMVKYLVKMKELVGFEKKRDKNGKTPGQLARKRGRYDIASLLTS